MGGFRQSLHDCLHRQRKHSCPKRRRVFDHVNAAIWARDDETIGHVSAIRFLCLEAFAG